MTKFKFFLAFCIFLLASFIVLININNKKAEEKETQVVFWTVQLSPFSSYMQNVIKEFETKNPNIKIKWIDIPYSEAEKRVLASLLSNNMPDLINITADFNTTLSTKGALLNIETGMENYSNEILKAVTYNNKTYGIPFYATSAITIFNKDLVNEFNITTHPQTYIDLFNIINKSKQIKNKYLFMPTLTENDTLYKILNKYNLASHSKINTQKSVEFFTQLAKLYNDEKIPKEAITQTHREVLEKYSSGQIAYLQAGANFLNIIKENSLDIYEKTDITYQLYGTKKEYDFSLMTLAIPLKSQKQKEAILFAQFLTNEENQLEFAKLTGVLPCNKLALNNEYFKETQTNNLDKKARTVSAKQLLNPISYPQQTNKHKEILTLINKTTEQILLENENPQTMLNTLSKNWKTLSK